MPPVPRQAHGDESDDDVVYLPDPPAYLRRVSNQENPIELSSDSEDDAGGAGGEGDDDELEDTEDDDEDAATSSRAPTGSRGAPHRGANPSPTRRRKRRRIAPSKDRQEPPEKMMDISFSDDEIIQLPLGWGGLGVARLPEAGPSRTRNSGKANANAVAGPSRKRRRSDTASSSASVAPSHSASPTKRKSKEKEQPAEEEEDVFPHLADPPSERTLQAADLLVFVLEVLPDLCPTWALDKIKTELSAGRRGSVVEVTMQAALEMDSYPRAQTSPTGSRKCKDREADAYKSVTYRVDQRKGWRYAMYTTHALADLFPKIPIPYLRETTETKSNLLAPAYFILLRDSQEEDKPYVELKRSRPANTLAREKAKEEATDRVMEEARRSAAASHTPLGATLSQERIGDGGEGEFWREKAWLETHIAEQQAVKDAAEEKERARADALANGHGIECGCCFGEEILEDMFQCPEGHLFCRDCCTSYVENKLGEEIHMITCMDMSGCKVPLTESELARLLSDKSLQLYYRLKQDSELEAAAIEGLESCPSCPFAAIIENAEDKVFRCMNPECRMVSCRKCKEKDHIPKSCEEYATDKKADRRHVVEDAMSEALIRKCPACKKPYIKDTGCNKIMCTKCGALSCYICQQLVKGYDHFDQGAGRVPNPPAVGVDGKALCILWDSLEAQHDQEAVVAARDAAQARVRREAEADGVDLAPEDLAVEAPVVRGPAPGYPGVNYVPAHPQAAVQFPNLPIGMPLAQQEQFRAGMDRMRRMVQGQVDGVQHARALHFAERARLNRGVEQLRADVNALEEAHAAAQGRVRR